MNSIKYLDYKLNYNCSVALFLFKCRKPPLFANRRALKFIFLFKGVQHENSRVSSSNFAIRSETYDVFSGFETKQKNHSA